MIICRCNEVSLKEIREFLKKHPNASLDNVTDKTSAASGCGRCKPLLKASIKKIKKELPKDNQLSLGF